ncbi:MAG: hypothetical protein J0G28_07550 [Afipia sp.]|nr:hypothetical protein [Afipia sp.]
MAARRGLRNPANSGIRIASVPERSRRDAPSHDGNAASAKIPENFRAN